MKLDLSGARFGRLVGVRPIGADKHGASIWEFRCDCGSVVARVGKVVKRGDTSSCGCLDAESRKTRLITHGATHTPAYRVWRNMITRCYNKNSKSYKDYGERGIVVCYRWGSFASFLEDMGQPPKGMTLERTDNNGWYGPDNCVWASRTVQSLNRRNMNLIEFRGERLSMREVAKRVGIKYTTFRARLVIQKLSLSEAIGGQQHVDNQ